MKVFNEMEEAWKKGDFARAAELDVQFWADGPGQPEGRANSQVRERVHQMCLNNYNLPEGWYLASAPIITANWEASSGNKWVVPFGGGIGKILRIAKLPFNGGVSAFYNAVKPDVGPDWTLRIQLALLLPKSVL